LLRNPYKKRKPTLKRRIAEKDYFGGGKTLIILP